VPQSRPCPPAVAEVAKPAEPEPKPAPSSSRPGRGCLRRRSSSPSARRRSQSRVSFRSCSSAGDFGHNFEEACRRKIIEWLDGYAVEVAPKGVGIHHDCDLVMKLRHRVPSSRLLPDLFELFKRSERICHRDTLVFFEMKCRARRVDHAIEQLFKRKELLEAQRDAPSAHFVAVVALARSDRSAHEALAPPVPPLHLGLSPATPSRAGYTPGVMMNSGTRPKAAGPAGVPIRTGYDPDLDGPSNHESDHMALDHEGAGRFGAKRSTEREEPSPTRQRGEPKAATLDDIRTLLQSQTRSLTESHQQDLQDLKTATFKELGTLKKDMRKHGDFIEQLRDNQDKIEERLRSLADKAAGSTMAGSDPGRPNLMIFGGWPQDTKREVLLEELTQCLAQLGLQDTFEDYFCTGPRRGFAMALLSTTPHESGPELKKRMISVAQQVQKANLSTKSMEQGRCLRASLGKSKHERMISNHAGKTKRLILTAAPNAHSYLETEYAAGNVWLNGVLIASATRPTPTTNCSQGKLERSWINIQKISEQHDFDQPIRPGKTVLDFSGTGQAFLPTGDPKERVPLRHLAEAQTSQARSEYVMSELGGHGLQMLAPRVEQWNTPTSRPRRANARGHQIDGISYKHMRPAPLRIAVDSFKQIGGDHDRILSSFHIRDGEAPDPPRAHTRPRTVTRQLPSLSEVNQSVLQELAQGFTKPKPGGRYRDPPDVKDLYKTAKRTKRESDWKLAHKARRSAQEKWRTGQLEQAAAGQWQSFRNLNTAGGSEWAVHYIEMAEQEKQEPKKWTVEHFQKLFQNTVPRSPPRWNKPIDTGHHFSLEDLRAALHRGKLNKSVGEDLVSFEIIKSLCEDPTTEQSFLEWMERIRCGEEMPREWLRTVVTLLPKTDKPRGPKDLRPISVGAAAAKVFGMMLLMRTRSYIRPAGPWQCAHGGRQTADYLFAAIKSFSLETEWHLGLCWCKTKIDIQKAFDTLSRDRTLRLLRDQLPPEMFMEYRCWERLFYEGTAVLKTPWGDAEIPQGRGIRQGSVESPFLFSIAIEMAISQSIQREEWPKTIPSIPDLPLAELLYMDDTLLRGANREDLATKYRILKEELAGWGLAVNPEKTAFYQSPYSTSMGPIVLDGQKIESSQSLSVFGIPLAVPLKPTTLMDTAMAKASKKFYANKHVFMVDLRDGCAVGVREAYISPAYKMAWLFIGLMTILAGHEGPATIAGAEHYRDDRPSISQVGTHVMHHEHHDFTTADATGEFVVSSNMTPRTAAETEADNYDGIYKPRPDHRDIATEGQNYSKPVMRAQNRGHRQAPNVENGGEMAINSPGQEYTVDPVLNDATSLSQYSLAIGAKWSKALMITLPAMAFEEMMPGEEPPWYWNLIDQGQELVRQGANGYDLGWQIVHSLLNHNDQALLTDMDLHYNGILRALQQEQRRHHHQRGTLLCAEEAQQRYVNKVVSTVVCHWMQGDVYARTRKRCRSNSPPANSPGVPDEQESDIQDLMESSVNSKLVAGGHADNPVLPATLMDNIVETLVDRPPEEHQLLVEALQTFVGRVQLDLATTVERARKLRRTLQGSGSSTDKPTSSGPDQPRAAKDRATEEEEEEDTSIYMQTDIRAAISTASNEDVLLSKLHQSLHNMPPAVASSRALRLMSLLQDHDGYLAVDRACLEALLISTNQETPPLPEGEALILEHSWCGVWWSRLRGQPSQDMDEAEIEIGYMDELQARRERTQREAEEADQAAREAAYQRFIEDAAESHEEQKKANRAQQEEDEIMEAALGFSNSRPTKRLCVGICITDEVTTKAWDWQLRNGTNLQVHIKAEPKSYPGQWFKSGRPVPEHQVPSILTTNQTKQEPPQPECRKLPYMHYDLGKPATRELFERWRKGRISSQGVVQASSVDMLAFFEGVQSISNEELADLDRRDTLSLQVRPADPGQPSASTDVPRADAPAVNVPEFVDSSEASMPEHEAQASRETQLDKADSPDE
ncbi:pol, partial [Symbiodinium sp. KB8]